jgi:hypothetical protein
MTKRAKYLLLMENRHSNANGLSCPGVRIRWG